MSIEDFGSIGEAIAALAVLASLVYLAVTRGGQVFG